MATIRQIEIFLQLAENLHFARTAEKLGITQAALSKEIRSLEQSINCRLLDRSDKWNIQLSAAGRAYFNQVKNLPQQLDLAQKSALRASRGETGTLAIAVSNMVYDHLPLGEILRKMHKKYPGIKLSIRDFQGSPMIYNEIISGNADIGFLAISNHHQPPEHVAHLPLTELELSLAIPAQHPLAHKQTLQLSDFINCNFIMPPSQHAPWLRNYFEKIFLEQCGTPLRVEQEALGLRATRQLVSAGLGIGFVIKPSSLDKQENIVYRQLPFDFKRIICAVWDEKNQSQILKNFRKLISEVPSKIV
ncbi:MAG: LysR family transcriptional regulator [Lentisphaerae bacterium]|nr:LysR family transcriptional regulator [Lentisphaerota bacterium]